MRKFIYILVIIMSAMAFSPSSLAKDDSIFDTSIPRIHLTGGSVAAGIGWTWGEGVLSFQGVDHKFKIKGLSIADVGISKITANGIVNNLKSLDEFNGVYYGVKTDTAIAGGVGALVLKNNHGVVLEMNASEAGLKFALGPEGVNIKLND